MRNIAFSLEISTLTLNTMKYKDITKTLMKHTANVYIYQKQYARFGDKFN